MQQAPLAAADVRKPERREWPEKDLGSNPASFAYFLTMFATDLPLRRVTEKRLRFMLWSLSWARTNFKLD
jgi:hypothetical protein